MLAISHFLWTEAKTMPADVHKEIGSRIRESRAQAGLTQEDLGARIGYSKFAVSKWEAGTRPISIDVLRLLANTLRKPVGYFVRSDTEGLQIDPKFSEMITTMDLSVLPVYGLVNAGHPNFVMNIPNDYVTLPKEVVGQARFAVRVRGESMVGLDIHDGDLLFVRPQDDADNGDIVVARINGDEYAVKRLRRPHKGNPYLESANPDYGPVIGEDLRIVGKVVGQFRER